jgi:hypothetical protein
VVDALPMLSGIFSAACHPPIPAVDRDEAARRVLENATGVDDHSEIVAEMWKLTTTT